MKLAVGIALYFMLATSLALTSQEAKDKFKKAHEKCEADPATKVNQDDFKAFKTDHKVTDNLKTHALCISKTLGWQTADGKINKESVKEKIIGYLGQSDQLEDIYAECLVDHENEKDTAIQLFKCYKKHFADKHTD